MVLSFISITSPKQVFNYNIKRKVWNSPYIRILLQLCI